jgi:hypothetical protein
MWRFLPNAHFHWHNMACRDEFAREMLPVDPKRPTTFATARIGQDCSVSATI